MSTTPPLPRGRHKLSREQVALSQRERMMLAMAAAMAEKGYAATSVADILKGAGVSRETFYQQFDAKLDCFLATFDAAGDLLLQELDSILADVDPAAAPHERFERILTTYLDTLASQPAFARVFTVEVVAAGPEAMARRAVLQHRIAAALVEVLEADDADARFACELLVAGISTLVTLPLVEADIDALHNLRQPILDLVRRATVPRQVQGPVIS